MIICERKENILPELIRPSDISITIKALDIYKYTLNEKAKEIDRNNKKYGMKEDNYFYLVTADRIEEIIKALQERKSEK